MSNAMILLTPEELRTLVIDAVREAGVAAAQPPAPAEPSEVMTREQAAEFLHVNPHQLPKLIKEGLPAHRFGESQWRFLKRELVDWVALGDKTPIVRKAIARKKKGAV
jgi:excisionase family DNA binding protein